MVSVTAKLLLAYRELAGIYNGNQPSEEESMFLTELHCFSDLLEGITSPCLCGMTRQAWMLQSLVKVSLLFGGYTYYISCVYIERPCSSNRIQLPTVS